MSVTHLQARWVFPLDRPPIEGGVVSIDGEQIAAVESSCVPSRQVADLGDVALIPGLVNAHTHSEFSDFTEPLGERGMRLADWIRLVIATRKRTSRDAAAAVRSGVAESLRRGVTTVGEIATVPWSSYRDHGLSRLVAFHEVIAFSLARKDSVLADVRRQLMQEPSSALPVLPGVSPHAPYTVHPRAVDEIVSVAREWQLPVAMHLAESREELELLENGSGPFRDLLEERGMWDPEAIARGTRPLDYLRQLAEAPRSLVIHGNYLAEDEVAFLAKRRDRMSVVYCPRTHDYFRHPPYPLRQMLDAGARVALGTDSRASNPNLCLVSEMRHVAEQHSSVSPMEILEMATRAGAEALGLGEEVGTITPGKLSDLVALPCGKGASPLEEVLHATSGPACVFVRGKECQESKDESREPD